MSDSTIPNRQIRAQYDDNTITVYQAYNSTIATAAVAAQKLDASPAFKASRMTWIKPSWCWMMYRAGYSYKDANQAHILALKMTRSGFETLLRNSLVNEVGPGAEQKALEAKGGKVQVQWDPERSPRIGKLEYRSIQIGVPVAFLRTWIEEWIVGIEDVTDKARELKRVLDEDKSLTRVDLLLKGVVPFEQEYPLDEELRRCLNMD